MRCTQILRLSSKAGQPALAATSLLLVACSGGGGGGSVPGPDGSTGSSEQLSVPGTITGTSPADPERVIVGWVVSSGSPDYVFKFGEGTTTANGFQLTFESAPPAEAINSYGVGVGVVFMLAPGLTPPDGEIDESLDYTGISARHAVIWRDEFSNDTLWFGDFPTGYSCGVCVPNPSGTFDSFAPTDCSEVSIETDLVNADVCNWT